MMLVIAPVALVALILAAVWVWRRLYERGLHRCAIPYIVSLPKRRMPRDSNDVHLLLCIADHFEPLSGKASPELAWARINRWLRDYPRQLGDFRDSDGRPPRHTFFYPIDEYDPAHVDAIAGLCRAGFGELEIHLHHNHDNAENLRTQLMRFKAIFAERHGMLARHRDNGKLAYGFIHGNWALCNARPDGLLCGVNEELDILRETGCYADFTMPSAPHVTQTSKINSIYYAVNRPSRARSHDGGVDIGTNPPPANSLMLIQGPLVLEWSSRKGRIAPRLENGCVQDSQPATLARVRSWLRARVQVPSRPDWYFVKLHAHGAQETSQQALLGEQMVEFHRGLAQEARRNPRFHYHYISAREMYNLAKAAEADWKGSIAASLNYELIWNAVADAKPDGKESSSLPAATERKPGFLSVTPDS